MTIRREEPNAPADRDGSVAARGMQALAEARAQGTLPPEEADRVAVEEVRAVRRARRLGRSPWTSPDPQPGDFDADLDGIDPRRVETRSGNRDAKVTVVATVPKDAAGPG